MRREPNVVYFSELTNDIAAESVDIYQHAELSLAMSRLTDEEQELLYQLADCDGDIGELADKLGKPVDSVSDLVAKIITKAKGGLNGGLDR